MAKRGRKSKADEAGVPVKWDHSADAEPLTIEPREMQVTPEGIEFAAELGHSPEVVSHPAVDVPAPAEAKITTTQTGAVLSGGEWVKVPDGPIHYNGVIVGRCIAGVGYPSTVEDARRMLGLLPEDVLAGRVRPEDGKVVVVTRGGVKLVWPDDIEKARTLTQSQKDGQWPGGKDPSSKPWNEPPKDPDAKG